MAVEGLLLNVRTSKAQGALTPRQSAQGNDEPDERRVVTVTVAARDEAARWLVSGGKDQMSPLLLSTVRNYALLLEQRGENRASLTDMVIVRRMLLDTEGTPAAAGPPPPVRGAAGCSPNGRVFINGAFRCLTPR